MLTKLQVQGSAKVCMFKYGEPIKVKVKISIPKLSTWSQKENKV